MRRAVKWKAARKERDMAIGSSIPSEYNEFLFATIAEEENKTPLSVLSALTRLDIDPWQEAERLSKLPRDQAVKDINTTLAALPGRRWTTSESNKIAACLVELLPLRKDHKSSLAGDLIGRRVVLALTLMWIVFASAWLAFVAWTSNPNHPDIHAADAAFARHLESL